MNAKQLAQLDTFFNDYAARFYCDDDYVNANLKLKEDHSRRVIDEILHLADHLCLDENQQRIARATALLHDIARFPQFAEYKTYHDPRSINHCRLAVKILTENRALDHLDPHEKQLILKAVEYHGIKELPDNLPEEQLLFCRLIRDADKIDICYIMAENYKRHRNNPDDFQFEVELPDEPYCSPHVVDALLNKQNIDYSRLKTWNDMKLANLAWVYDVNFTPTLQRIKQRRFLETILEFLPDTPEIQEVRHKIFSYVNSRLAAGK